MQCHRLGGQGGKGGGGFLLCCVKLIVGVGGASAAAATTHVSYSTVGVEGWGGGGSVGCHSRVSMTLWTRVTPPLNNLDINDTF